MLMLVRVILLTSFKVSQATYDITEEASASTEEQCAGLHEIINSADNLEQLPQSLKTSLEKFKSV